MTSTPAVVLTLSSDPLMHGPLGVARSLGRLGVPVHVAHPGGRVPLDASRYVERRVWLADRDAAVEQLHRAAQAFDTRPVLVPVDDDATLLLDDHAEQLSGDYLFPRRPPGLSHRLASKRGLTEICQRLGIPAPSTSFPGSRQEAVTAASTAVYPVMVKAVDPLLLRRAAAGARSVTLARDQAELLAAYDLLASGGRDNVMVQEYIPGGPDAIWMFNGYFDAGSRCRFGATGVKLRQCPPDTGPTSLGVIRENAHVQRSAQRLLGELGYAGIVDMGFRYDGRDGRYKMLDVNPRIGGTFRLFTGDGGLDVARALYLDLTGQEVPHDSVVPGRVWHDEPRDLLAQAIYHRQGRSPWPQWAGSVRGADERAWYAADDLRPFVQMWRHVATRAARGVSLVTRSGGAGPESRELPEVSAGISTPARANALS
ncbi:MAG: hypothetical protein ACRDPH_13770 [Marmoricola sp.]